MEIKQMVNLTGEEAKQQFYGIIAEFYLAGSRPFRTFSARRKMMEMFNENEIEDIMDYAMNCKRWYKTNPKNLEITMDDYLFYRRIADWCYKCQIKSN